MFNVAIDGKRRGHDLIRLKARHGRRGPDRNY
jgi:hypothetical protein